MGGKPRGVKQIGTARLVTLNRIESDFIRLEDLNACMQERALDHVHLPKIDLGSSVECTVTLYDARVPRSTMLQKRVTGTWYDMPATQSQDHGFCATGMHELFGMKKLPERVWFRFRRAS